MTNKELLEDLLVEFDELGMEPTTIVPNPSERAIRWKRELMSAIEHWGAEVAMEIFEEIERKLLPEINDLYTIEICREIKKKYTATDTNVGHTEEKP